MRKPVEEGTFLPKRMFCSGKKKLVSVRLHQKLVDELALIAKEKQWDLSEVVTTALDAFIQFEKRLKRRGT